MLKSDTSGIKSTSVLPPTVVDQIRLWESERNRFTYTEGVVYNQFLSQVTPSLCILRRLTLVRERLKY